MNVNTSPAAWQPKHLYRPVSSRTLNEPLFSAWNGHRPSQFRPTRFNATYCWIVSTTDTVERRRSMSSSWIPMVGTGYWPATVRGLELCGRVRRHVRSRTFLGECLARQFVLLFVARRLQREPDRRREHDGDHHQGEPRGDVVPLGDQHLDADEGEDDREPLLQV